MNCHDLETIAGDLAKGRLMDSAERENALTHAASCARCALRIEDEHALTGGLLAVGRTADVQAPARVEAALLTAFREHHTAMPDAVAPTATRRWLFAAAAVAAVAVIVTVLALMASRNRTSERQAPQQADSANKNSPQQKSPVTVPESPVAEQKAAAQRASRKHGTNSSNNTARTPDAISDASNQAGAEIATDFIPLMNRESLAELDWGQVMRVELPRSALMSFGLPMNMERAGERIKADVVVGNDGLARAIRFVR